MSYKALYRKYRPQNFADVLGQDHVVKTLENIIKHDKTTHAYLFAGPRGTGKTSVAHVFAQELNRNLAGEIETNLLDIIEIDAASNNGVAEIRKLIDSSKYTTTSARYKIYIIDEAHMLTKGAFNAFLKTLEEPPSHVVFILATTEPDRLPITILSRLQRFNFHRIPQKVIIKHLQDVLKREQITYDQSTLKVIAQLARGGLRDALSIADQVAAYGNNQIKSDDLFAIFGIIATSEQLEILQQIYEHKMASVLEMVNKLFDEGVDLERLTIGFVKLLKDYIVFAKTQSLNLVEFLTGEELNKLNISLPFAYAALDILMPVITELKFSQVSREIFELAILKMVQINYQPSKKEGKVDLQAKEQTTKPNEITSDILAKENDIISSEQISKTQEILLDNLEQEAEGDDLAESILTTQEIDLAPNPNKEESLEEEIAIENMFSDSSEEESFDPLANNPHPAWKFAQDEVINMLIQANKQEAPLAKNKLLAIGKYISDVKTGSYASLLEGCALIAKGPNFLLLTSKDEQKIMQLKIDARAQGLINLMFEVFKEPLNIYAITYNEFEQVKSYYKKLALTKKLPQAKLIKPPQIIKPISEAQKLGSDIFGELLENQEE